MTPKRVTLADIGAPVAASVPRVSIAASMPAHHAAFHALTPEQRDAHVAPIRDALESLSRQTAPMRATLTALAAQTQRAFPDGITDGMRAITAEIEKAETIQAAILVATPKDRRPYMRHVLRNLLKPLPISDAVAALSALHDYLTADIFGRLFPQGRAWGMAWVLASVIRGKSVDLRVALSVTTDTTRLGTQSLTRTPEIVPPQRTYRERRERYRRRPAPSLSNRLAPHGPPRAFAAWSVALPAPARLVTHNLGPP